MTTVNECESVSIKYTGNGTQRLFTFPFTYMSTQDIVCFLYNDITTTWVNQENKFIFANATTVEFLTPPPSPDEANFKNVWITRRTDLDSMLASFFPGSSIRANDLNNDFDQLRLAIQEGRCALADLKDGEYNYYTKNQYFTRPDQESGKWIGTGDQMVPVTSGAAAARHDNLVQPNTPPTVTYQQPGKGWENTDDCWSSYWNPEAEAWVAYVNTGPRGVPGQDGADADITVGATTTSEPGGNAEVVNVGTGAAAILNFTIPRGERGPAGTGITVTGYIDQPGPPSSSGTEEGDFVIDSNGNGWFWETDTDPATWVDTGTIRGPKGDQGNAGQDGDAATIAVGNTTTSNAGTNASVVNTGTSSAAVFNFTIPKGAKGDPGTGSGTVEEIVASNPIVVTNKNGPTVALSLDLSTLSTLP